jgi:hypothetical protein
MLQNWMTHLVHCIVKWCYDPKTQQRMGMTILVQHELLSQLEQEVSDSSCPFPSILLYFSKSRFYVVIDTYCLSQYQNPKLYLGRSELKLIAQQLFDAITPAMFLQRIQTWIGILTIFYCMSRGSSIAATHVQYATQQKVL